MDEARFSKILSSKLFLFLLLTAALLLSYSFGKELYRKHQLQKEFDAMQAEVDKLKKNNGDLASLIDYLGKEDALEKEARLRLNLKKPGENVVVIVPPQGTEAKEGESPAESSQAQAAESQNNQNGRSWIENTALLKWRDYFFKEK